MGTNNSNDTNVLNIIFLITETKVIIMSLFERVDFEAVQLMYGFVLLALALVAALLLPGNVQMLTAIVCLLLIKDGLPNFVVGFMSLGQKNTNKKEA